MSIHCYLTFNGNCRKAMSFYKKCLGGKLTFQTIGESPLSEKMPQQMKDCILHATLARGPLLLMGSDMVSNTGLIKGNAISLSLECDNAKELKSSYKKLSAGGKSTHPIEETFFGALLGSLTDKFGNNWLLYCNKNKNKTTK